MTYLQTTHRTGLVALALLLSAGAAVRAQDAPDTRPNLPVREGSFQYKDTRLNFKSPVRAWEVYLPPRPEPQHGPLKDPKFNVDYPFRMQVRVVGGGDDENTRRTVRRFVIHYLKPADEPLARQIGGVMARLFWITQDYLGRPALGDESTGNWYVNIWLTHDGMAGAEQYLKDIFVYKIDEPRAPAEWVRELAHEWSHLVLPPLGPYTQPEKWASGYLGERLLLKWMLADNGQSGAWSSTTPINGEAYVTNQVLPLRKKYLDAGPAAPAGEKTDADGMDYFIGQLLAIEQAHGPQFLKSVIDKFGSGTPNPRNIGLNLWAALRDRKVAQFTLDPDAFIPARSQPDSASVGGEDPKLKKAAYWLFLPGGEWEVDVEGDVPAGSTAALETTALKKVAPAVQGATAAWSTSITTTNGMWRRLELAAPPGRVLALKQITVSRSDALGILGGPAAAAPPAPGSGTADRSPAAQDGLCAAAEIARLRRYKKSLAPSGCEAGRNGA